MYSGWQLVLRVTEAVANRGVGKERQRQRQGEWYVSCELCLFRVGRVSGWPLLYTVHTVLTTVHSTYLPDSWMIDSQGEDWTEICFRSMSLFPVPGLPGARAVWLAHSYSQGDTETWWHGDTREWERNGSGMGSGTGVCLAWRGVVLFFFLTWWSQGG